MGRAMGDETLPRQREQLGGGSCGDPTFPGHVAGGTPDPPRTRGRGGTSLRRAVGRLDGHGGTGSTRGDLLKGSGPPGSVRYVQRSRISPEPRGSLALPPQSLMDAQNSRIEELLQKIKQQQYKLDKQNLQIKSLQSKVSSRPALQPGVRSLVPHAAGPSAPWHGALVTGEPAVSPLLGFGDPAKAVALVLALQR